MKKVNYLINNNLISRRLHQFDQLTGVIAEFVSMPLENRVWPLLRGRKLTLLTDDPHLATQVRFMEKQLCNHINKTLKLRIIGVDIKVMSLPLARGGRNIHRKKVSPQTSAIVGSIADSIEDPELQGVLKRLINAECTNPADT